MPMTMSCLHQPLRGHQPQRNRDSEVGATLTRPGSKRASSRTEGLASTTECGEGEAPPSQEPAQGAVIRGEGRVLGDHVVNSVDNRLPLPRKEGLTPAHADQWL